MVGVVEEWAGGVEGEESGGQLREEGGGGVEREGDMFFGTFNCARSGGLPPAPRWLEGGQGCGEEYRRRRNSIKGGG